VLKHKTIKIFKAFLMLCVLLSTNIKIRFVLNKILLILVLIMFSLNGCGYKANPYYKDSAPKSDENVKFVIKKSS